MIHYSFKGNPFLRSHVVVCTYITTTRTSHPIYMVATDVRNATFGTVSHFLTMLWFAIYRL